MDHEQVPNKPDCDCLAIDCGKSTGGLEKYFCVDHWDELLATHRDALIDAYQSGQADSFNSVPSLEWCLAIQVAVGYLAFHESRWSWSKSQQEITRVRKMIARRDAGLAKRKSFS